MGNSLFMNICIWIFLWWIPWMGFYTILHKRHIDYIHKYYLTSFYFLSITVLLMILFRQTLAPYARAITITPFYSLIFFYISAFTLYFLSQQKFAHVISHWKTSEEPKTFTFFLLMDYRFLVSKSCEILFQQTMIVLLVSFLKSANLSFEEIIGMFTLIFGLCHIPAIFVRKHKFSWYMSFTFASFLSGIIFPIIILSVAYGFVYTYILHWCFYLGTGMIITIRKHNELLKLAI